MTAAESGVGRLLRPSYRACVAAEFFSATAHVPVTIALAMILVRPFAEWPLVLPLLAGAFLQAWMIGGREQSGRPPLAIQQLVGCCIYGATLTVAHLGFPTDPLLWIFVVSSCAVALCHVCAVRLGGLVGEGLFVCAHIVRALAVVAVYAAIAAGDPRQFLSEPEHRFLVVGTALLGLALGASAVVHRRDRERLADVVDRLKGYSEMLLGRSMLTRAMENEDDLRPRRTRRSVLFADIRGFTRWSETRSPEEVLLMLDGVYSAAESACARFKPARTKHTGDEVMMFFAEPIAAAEAALALRDEVGSFLSLYGLHVGIGIHHGEVIEGLVGASRTKAYDILGDTVNTAKRVSDHAKPGRIVVTFTFFEACRGRAIIEGDEHLSAKGKSSLILISELIGIHQAVEG